MQLSQKSTSSSPYAFVAPRLIGYLGGNPKKLTFWWMGPVKFTLLRCFTPETHLISEACLSCWSCKFCNTPMVPWCLLVWSRVTRSCNCNTKNPCNGWWNINSLFNGTLYHSLGMEGSDHLFWCRQVSQLPVESCKLPAICHPLYPRPLWCCRCCLKQNLRIEARSSTYQTPTRNSKLGTNLGQATFHDHI